MMDVLMRWGSGMVAVLIGWVLTVALHRQQIAWERHLFGVALGKTGIRVIWVLGTGLLLSLVPSLLWLWVDPLPPTLLWLWAGLTLGWALFYDRLAQPLRVLLFLFAFSFTIQSISAQSWVSWPWLEALRTDINLAMTASIRGWWVAASSILLSQGLAYWLLPPSLYSPYLGRTHRGGIEAGYRLTSWLTLLGVSSGVHGSAMVPLFIPLNDMYPGRLPKPLARKKGTVYVLLGLFMIGLIALSALLPIEGFVYRPLATVLILLTIESSRTIVDRLLVQGQRTLLPAQEGLTILAVVPESPAARLGFVPGERITQVNGKKVNTIAEYYRALQESPAFTRFQGFDQASEMILRQGPRYEGDHHLYGLIFVPPQADVTWDRQHRLLQAFRKKTKDNRLYPKKKGHERDKTTIERHERSVQG